MNYELNEVLPSELLEAVEPGTNLLVSGPAMSGKRELLLRILAAGAQHDEGAIVITARDPSEEVIEDYRSNVPGEGYIRVLDAVSSRSGNAAETGAVRHVSSPGDLTGMGIEFSELARAAQGDGVTRIRIGFDSLSPLLMYVDLQRLFRFLHVFTSQIQSRNWFGLFSIDPDSHDPQVVNTLSQLFDGIIEIRLTDDGDREARVRGLESSPTDWVPLDLG